MHYHEDARQGVTRSGLICLTLESISRLSTTPIVGELCAFMDPQSPALSSWNVLRLSLRQVIEQKRHADTSLEERQSLRLKLEVYKEWPDEWHWGVLVKLWTGIYVDKAGSSIWYWSTQMCLIRYFLRPENS